MTAAGADSGRTLGFVALLAGTVAISLAAILVRMADVSPTASAFWRVAIAAPVLWLWVLASRPAVDSPFQFKADRAVLLAGLFFACDLGAWHLSIAWTSVANATLEANFAPVFVTLGAWLLWRQRPSGLFVLALVLTLAGAVLLIVPNMRLGGQALEGDALGVLTAVFYAGYMLSLKSATLRQSTARIMAVSTTVSAMALAPYALATADVFLPQDMTGWLVLIVLAIIPHVAGQSLIAYGFARLPAGLSSLVLLLQAVLSSLFAWLLLGEAMSAMQMAGAVIVLAGIYLARKTG